MGPGTRGLAVLAVLWAVSAHGQPWWVRGTVLDAATGEPLPAATVRLAGTFRGTIANDEGAYRIEVRRWPAVEEGRLRSVEGRFEWGGPYRPFGLRANRRVEVKVEHGGALGGDFSFSRLHLALDGHFKTLLRRRSAPNALDLRLVAGYAFGRLPLQRFGTLEAGLLPFSPFGVFRTVRGHPHEGEHYAALYWEHNFRSAPFELLGLWDWAMRGAGLVVHGASGRTWIDPERLAGLGYDPRYEDGFRHEAGVSLVLFHLLRLDVTRRLDRAGWSAGASLARFDSGTFGISRR